MRLLFVFRHRKSVEPFVGVVERALERGHTVRVLVQEADEKVPTLFEPHRDLSFASFALGRGDEWRDAAPLLRSARDYLQYLGPAYRGARKLRNRAFERLLFQLGIPLDAAPPDASEAALVVPDDAVAALHRFGALVERSIPSDALHEQSLNEFRPDVVLASPLVHFGSAQADFVKAARALGIPVGMLLFSWDNLSTKGALHVEPDRLFVWNDRQQREALELHGFPPERTRVTGAARFDRFFALRPMLTREAFCAPFDLDPSKPILLYLCSSRLVSEREPAFIRQWRNTLRRSPHPELRDATLIVRPHPDLPVKEKKWLGEERNGQWDGLDIVYRARRMFGDAATLLLSSASQPAAVLHECLYHSRAAVGLNTSAEIEAAIVGRPVFTILADESHADGQQSTLHFRYLASDEGGWVTISPTLEDHERQLAATLAAPPRTARIQELVGRFVRPGGWDVPASHVLVSAIEEEFQARPSATVREVRSARRTEPVPVTRQSAPPVSRRLPSGEEVQVVALEYDGPDVWVAVSNADETARAHVARRSPAIVRWLPQVASPGRPFFVLGSESGHVALMAARAFGATAFAFEPDIPSLSRLWTNALLNGCEGNLVPMPVAIGSKRALQEQRSAAAAPAAERYPGRRRIWREHPGSVRMVMQPCLAMPLDSAIKTWALPAPSTLYLGPGADIDEILAGAAHALENSVTSVIIEGSDTVPLALLTAAGFTVKERAEQPEPALRNAVWLARG